MAGASVGPLRLASEEAEAAWLPGTSPESLGGSPRQGVAYLETSPEPAQPAAVVVLPRSADCGTLAGTARPASGRWSAIAASGAPVASRATMAGQQASGPGGLYPESMGLAEDGPIERDTLPAKQSSSPSHAAVPDASTGFSDSMEAPQAVRPQWSAPVQREGVLATAVALEQQVETPDAVDQGPRGARAHERPSSWADGPHGSSERCSAAEERPATEAHEGARVSGAGVAHMDTSSGPSGCGPSCHSHLPLLPTLEALASRGWQVLDVESTPFTTEASHRGRDGASCSAPQDDNAGRPESGLCSHAQPAQALNAFDAAGSAGPGAGGATRRAAPSQAAGPDPSGAGYQLRLTDAEQGGGRSAAGPCPATTPSQAVPADTCKPGEAATLQGLAVPNPDGGAGLLHSLLPAAALPLSWPLLKSPPPVPHTGALAPGPAAERPLASQQPQPQPHSVAHLLPPPQSQAVAVADPTAAALAGDLRLASVLRSNGKPVEAGALLDLVIARHPTCLQVGRSSGAETRPVPALEVGARMTGAPVRSVAHPCHGRRAVG
jgi:hypothetical protein